MTDAPAPSALVAQPGMTLAAVRVWLHLHNTEDRHQKLEAIARSVGISVRSVQRAVDLLVGFGWLGREDHRGDVSALWCVHPDGHFVPNGSVSEAPRRPRRLTQAELQQVRAQAVQLAALRQAPASVWSQRIAEFMQLHRGASPRDFIRDMSSSTPVKRVQGVPVR